MDNLFLYPALLTDPEALVQILHDADEGDARIRAALSDVALRSYAAYQDKELVGAAVVRWPDNTEASSSEIVLLAVASHRRRQGIGKWSSHHCWTRRGVVRYALWKSALAACHWTTSCFTRSAAFG
jgi:ribosomal protein S18 acetylase RimI-like enzyme